MASKQFLTKKVNDIKNDLPEEKYGQDIGLFPRIWFLFQPVTGRIHVVKLHKPTRRISADQRLEKAVLY